MNSLPFKFKIPWFQVFTDQNWSDDGKKVTNQEYDYILLMPEYKKIIIIEVKSNENGSGYGDAKKQLEKGRQFFKKVFYYFGAEDWEYVPILAFPNSTKQVDLI